MSRFPSGDLTTREWSTAEGIVPAKQHFDPTILPPGSQSVPVIRVAYHAASFRLPTSRGCRLPRRHLLLGPKVALCCLTDECPNRIRSSRSPPACGTTLHRFAAGPARRSARCRSLWPTARRERRPASLPGFPPIFLSPFLTDRKSRPSSILEAVSQTVIPFFSQTGTATVRMRPPLPRRSAITHGSRASECV